ncbi:hypothetical protein CRG98_008264 [Punica granatum]|uniref:Uncharacterized protein n=1 Tax=Punica granatum TaxID=22663 RepID=A0A2I0KRZ7_PUNGR|nr:hypothetical protein CRG98_008264 [Punica granatum]
MGQGSAGASSPSHPKRQYQLMPVIISFTFEPLGHEARRVLPPFGISVYSPCIDHYNGVSWHVVPFYRAVLRRQVRKQERDRSVQSKRLIDDTLEIVKFREIRLIDQMILADLRVDLCPSLFQHPRELDQICEHPL